MLKIKAKYDEKTNNFNIIQDAKNANFTEYFGVINALMDEILTQIDILDEEKLIEIIKNRKKYVEQTQDK